MIVCGKDYKKDFYINYGTQLVFTQLIVQNLYHYI